jgi:MFS family permease
VRPRAPETDAVGDPRRDQARLVFTRGARGFADGMIAVTLSAYLGDQLGWSGTRIGVVVAGMLAGSAVLTMLTGLSGSRFGRRALLRASALAMIGTGIVYATVETFWVLLLVGVIGTMNPSGGDVSVFRPLEQSVLAHITTSEERSARFARYVFAGALLAAAGSLAAGLPEQLGWSTAAAFAVYAVTGAVSALAYARLSPAAEPSAQARPTPLGASRAVVVRLSALFTIDALGGGFAVQSLLALWLFRRHDVSLAGAGAVFAATSVLTAASGFVAVRIESRIGAIRTMAFTHLPAQVFLMAAALMPNGTLAVACLLARSLLSSMDVPVRDAYVMSVVTPPERAAAASVTNVPRSLAAAFPPFVAGWMLDRSTFGWPLLVGGGLKALYDVLLLRMVDAGPPAAGAPR